jgi:superfamily I DNA/RNA helicase
LALDQAQDLRGATVSGFGRLGISDIAEKHLTQVYRSTKDILKLAFHVIQQTTDLFSSEFPDFTSSAVSIVPSDHPLAAPPELRVGGTGEGIGTYIVKQVRNLRSGKLRQVAIVIYGAKYWDEVHRALVKASQPIKILDRRGESIHSSGPAVILARPDAVGGQEFDAVIVVGAEDGTVPPRVESHGGLNATLEQQSLRSLYLSFTRARYRLVIVVSPLATLSPLLQSALKAHLIKKIQ